MIAMMIVLFYLVFAMYSSMWLSGSISELSYHIRLMHAELVRTHHSEQFSVPTQMDTISLYRSYNKHKSRGVWLSPTFILCNFRVNRLLTGGSFHCVVNLVSTGWLVDVFANTTHICNKTTLNRYSAKPCIPASGFQYLSQAKATSRNFRIIQIIEPAYSFVVITFALGATVRA